MAIEQALNDELKQAMRAKDADRLAAIRGVKSDMGKRLSEAGAPDEATDDDWVAVIAAFVKRNKKSKAEYDGLGERGAEMAQKLQSEIDYLSQWLPTKLDETATAALVAEAISSVDASSPADTGKVMGVIMGKHKDAVDAGLVNKLVKAALAE